jgi:hypothetical protein
MVYGHSVLPSADGMRAVASYWDAGFVLLDIADPARPLALGRTQYAPDEEGNAHSAALSPDGRLLVGADEDFTVAVKGSLVSGPPDLPARVISTEAAFTRPLKESGHVSGALAAVGSACPEGEPPHGIPGGDPLRADPAGRIALIDGALCHYALQLSRVEQAGAIAAVVVNVNPGPPVAMGTLPELPAVGIPAVMIRQDDGARLREALANGATISMTLGDDLAFEYNDWGFLRLFDVADPAHPRQVGRFGTANTFTDRVHGPPGDGEYMVHNPLLGLTALDFYVKLVVNAGLAIGLAVAGRRAGIV